MSTGTQDLPICYRMRQHISLSLDAGSWAGKADAYRSWLEEEAGLCHNEVLRGCDYDCVRLAMVCCESIGSEKGAEEPV